MAMSTKMVASASEHTERSILGIAPEQESLDWICYRVGRRVDPTSDDAAPKPRPRMPRRPGCRGGARSADIERALGHLVRLGMLSYSVSGKFGGTAADRPTFGTACRG